MTMCSDILLSTGTVQIALGKLSKAKNAFERAKEVAVKYFAGADPPAKSRRTHAYAVEDCLKQVGGCMKNEGSDRDEEIRMAAFTELRYAFENKLAAVEITKEDAKYLLTMSDDSQILRDKSGVCALWGGEELLNELLHEIG